MSISFRETDSRLGVRDNWPVEGPEHAHRIIDKAGRLGVKKLAFQVLKPDTLPESLIQHTTLEELHLVGSNRLVVPNWIARMTALRKLVLELGFCDSNNLPDSLGQLVNLEHLRINSEGLTTLPDSLGQLAKLRTLCVLDSQLTELPEGVGYLESLEELYLTRNRMRRLPSSFAYLRNLRELTLGKTYTPPSDRSPEETYGEVPPQVRHLHRLKRLNMDGCGITELPTWLLELRNLEQISLSFNPIVPKLANGNSPDMAAVKRYLRGKTGSSWW